MKKFLMLSFLVFLFSIQSVSAATGDVEGYAWGGGEMADTNGGIPPNNGVIDGDENGIGWISMNSTVAPTYAVNIPVSDGNLSGYAWSEHYGWISFNAGDVIGCPSGTCVAQRVGDNITGWARIISICDTGNAGNGHVRDGHCDANDDGWNAGGWNGWISLSGGNYGLQISKMDKSGSNPTYAYSDELGWIDFSFAGFGSTLKICEGSFQRSVALVPPVNIPFASTATKTLTAKYGAGDCMTDSPVIAVWSAADVPEDAVSLSNPLTTDTVTVTANLVIGVPSKSENITATYSGKTETAKAVVSCVARTCSDFAAQTNTYCSSESQTYNNNCGGTIACPGTRNCDFNFKETSP